MIKYHFIFYFLTLFSRLFSNSHIPSTPLISPKSFLSPFSPKLTQKKFNFPAQTSPNLKLTPSSPNFNLPNPWSPKQPRMTSVQVDPPTPTTDVVATDEQRFYDVTHWIVSSFLLPLPLPFFCLNLCSFVLNLHFLFLLLTFSLLSKHTEFFDVLW